jgi:hypothetical protein
MRLAVLDVVALVLWMPWLVTDPGSPVSLLGPLWWLPPISFITLAVLGFVVMLRMDERQRLQAEGLVLGLTTVLLLAPIALYILLGITFVGFETAAPNF